MSPDIDDSDDTDDTAGADDTASADHTAGADHTDVVDEPAAIGAPTAPPTGVADVLVRGNLVGTVLFAVTAGLAAGFFTTFWQWVAAITAFVLFAIGVFAFLWSYWNAVQRSRTDEIGVAQLYLLLGPPTPRRVRRVMLALLTAQFAIALATTFARLDGPDGNPGSSLALGFLVPMFGFGLNGLWAAYHGDFPRRREAVAE